LCAVEICVNQRTLHENGDHLQSFSVESKEEQIARLLPRNPAFNEPADAGGIIKPHAQLAALSRGKIRACFSWRQKDGELRSLSYNEHA
jgi:hypothetical protein